MSGTLYIIGTPIGNLEDITMRQLRLLGEVDFLAAEDTRVTRKLLSHYDIHTPIVSYHEHSGLTVAQSIADRILAGESCGVVTDAGMPCISDPGEDLVRLCAENGIDTKVIPGPSAAVSALALSGLDTGKFVFEGFLQPQANARRERLEELKLERRTIIFYEAPHKLCDTLNAMYQVLGERKITLARELTKVYEEVIRTTLSQAVELYTQREPRGEFVLVVQGAKEEQKLDFAQALALVQALVERGEPLSKAAKDVARQTGFKKGELYSGFLEMPAQELSLIHI